jgi:hypothetical protein
MSGSLPYLPITLPAKIDNGSTSVTRNYVNFSSAYNGYPYEFTVDMQIIQELNSDDRIGYAYTGLDIVPGMWYGQSTGLAYEIISVSNATQTTATLVLRDVNMYNCLSDPNFTGNNYPIENSYGIIFAISEDGDPIISALTLQSGVLPDSFYWVNDFYGRFQYRNFVQSNYNFDNYPVPGYGTYATGQAVYIGTTGPSGYRFIPVDTSSSSQVEKVFGIVSSVNQPEEGNLTVRPFGRIISTDYPLPGATGDVLYYDGTNPPSYVTNIKPVNALPTYIKITEYSASFLPGVSPSGSGATGSTGATGESYIVNGSGWIDRKSVV